MLYDDYPGSPPSPGFYIEHSKSHINRKMKYDQYHDFYELYYFLGDKMDYFIDNKTFYVNKHDMILINKFTYHRTSYMNNDRKDRILVAFDDSILDMLGNETVKCEILDLFTKRKLSFSRDFNKYLLDTFTNRILPEYYDSSSAVKILKGKLIFIELLLSILETAKNASPREADPLPNPRGKRISEIINYINDNYCEDLPLDLLCKTFFINKYYLCHIFKEIAGLSIIDFINKKRVVEAEKLLKYSKFTVTEIAGRVGFNSVNHFIGLFKKAYGNTPNAFRGQFVLGRRNADKQAPALTTESKYNSIN